MRLGLFFFPGGSQSTFYLIFWLFILYLAFTFVGLTQQAWGVDISKNYKDSQNHFGLGSTFVDFYDLDKNGYDDLLIAQKFGAQGLHGTGGGFLVYLNNGDRTFTESTYKYFPNLAINHRLGDASIPDITNFRFDAGLRCFIVKFLSKSLVCQSRISIPEIYAVICQLLIMLRFFTFTPNFTQRLNF